MTKNEKLKAFVLLATGFEESEAVVTIDLLRRARVSVKTVKVNVEGGRQRREKLVCGAHELTFNSDLYECEANPETADIVILPGGMPGTINLHSSPYVLSFVEKAAENGALICAICAAPRILGTMGLLQGKRATCYPGTERYLTGATIELDKPCIRDGNIITARSMGAAIPFGLEIIRAAFGDEKADEIEKSLVI